MSLTAGVAFTQFLFRGDWLTSIGVDADGVAAEVGLGGAEVLLLPVGDDDDEDEDDAEDDEGDDADHDVEQHPPRLARRRRRAGYDSVLGAAVGEAALDVVVVHHVLRAGDVGLAHVGGLPLVAVPAIKEMEHPI